MYIPKVSHEWLDQKLAGLPQAPGVYLFRGKGGQALYIGKALHLRNRVRSYFQSGRSDHRFFIERLESELEDIETFIVNNEKEAALLENTLIKQHLPRYNFKLRDDKDFLSLRVNPKTSWPRLEVIRRPKPDEAWYFGPYPSATSARQTLRLVNRHFQLRTCTDLEMKSRNRPCLQYQIKRCLAPCVLPVDKKDYADQLQQVALFLRGKHDELVELLEQRMKLASQERRYEQAATLRDQLRAIEQVRQGQHVVEMRKTDEDILGYHREEQSVCLVVLEVRSGKLNRMETFDSIEAVAPDEEVLSSFVSQYYGEGSFLPDEIVLPFAVEAMVGLEELLREHKGSRIRVMAPKRGKHLKLLQMAKQNAAHLQLERRNRREDVERKLEVLKDKLHLSKRPQRIECLDISHSAGKDTYGALVSFYQGKPDRARYRSFAVKKAKPGDDYAAMHEVLSRRFKRAAEGQTAWALPDLLLIDGGKGQLQIALRVLQELKLRLETVSIAKEREDAGGQLHSDRIFCPGQKNPVLFRGNEEAFRILVQARDEAHRFSNYLRSQSGNRRMFESMLENIPGVGPKLVERLLRTLGSVDGVLKADEQTLISAGLNHSQAKAVRAAAPTPKATADDLLEMNVNPLDAMDQAEQNAVDHAFSEE